MRARTRCAIWLVEFCALALAAAAETLTFVPVDVPGTPYGLNNAGQIVGTRVGGQSTTSYLYTEGSLLQIAVPDSTGPSSTLAYGLNNTGQIVGAFSSTAVDTVPFVDTNGNFSSFAIPSGTATSARGINDLGQIVGHFADTSGRQTGFLTSGGAATLLSVPGAANTFPYRITNSGEIVGYSVDRTGHESGFMYSNGVYQNITVPGSTDTLAYGINAAGEVVGSFIDQFGTHGFLYAEGSFTSFDAPNTLPTRGTFARDINDAGQILVTGSGNFLAIATPATPVPEPRPFPSALVAFGIGVLVMKGKSSLQSRRECHKLERFNLYTVER